MGKQKKITREFIEKYLYIKDSKFYWKPRSRELFNSERIFKAWNTKHSNKEAGIVVEENGNLYRKIWLNGGYYYAHRMVWCLFISEDIPAIIDHIDGNGLNNYFGNLRDGTCGVNNRNTRRFKINKSGISGVHWSADRSKWVVQGQKDGKTFSLGRYLDFFEACCVRKKYELINGFSERHGK